VTQWIAYVPTGQEFALVEDCEALGLQAIAPRKVEAVRTGNRRWPEKRILPYLGNYVFVEATAEQWHWLKDIKYLRSLMGVPPAEARKVQDFIDAVEATFTAKEAEIDRAVEIMRDREASKEARREALRVMQAYTPGDLLEVICGPFAGQIVAFGAMVERAASKLPEIEVSLNGLEWGTMRMDPLHVRKVG
jgi:transcription antitermination factor NusG